MRNFTTVLFPFVLFLLFNFQLIGQHTFSIVAVDPVTGEIGSAGATCISAEDGAQAISDIVLGVGAIHTQSFWDPENQTNARFKMEEGDTPQEIIDWLIANDVDGDASQRQYGVVRLVNGQPLSAAFTGADCFEAFKHVTGPNYAIAGNILISDDVIDDMESAFLQTEGTLAQKLMAAMQGAKRPGADERCLNFGISSASAFIRVAQPEDTDASYGNLSLDLNVWITTDIFEPIDALQDAFNVATSTKNESEVMVQVFPNPSSDIINIQTSDANILGYEVINAGGEILATRKSNVPVQSIYFDIADYPTGIYFVKAKITGGGFVVRRVVRH